jgi:DtxR family transcriptional regulator, Mn-dependent transcriptional regulator
MAERNRSSQASFSPAIEDYLKAIYLAQQPTGTASPSRIAAVLGRVQPSSVTGMVKRLAELQLVTNQRYHGVQLTPAGERVALHVLRRRRLIEQYLVEVLGLGLDDVHAEAERLEHVISDDVEARIAARLRV